MLTISLICNLGMSTSMLVTKMTEYAKKIGVEVDIDAMPFDKMGDRINMTDILLIGPQVRHLYKKISAEFGDTVPVIKVMDMSQYALMKADVMFDEAFKEYSAKVAEE